VTAAPLHTIVASTCGRTRAVTVSLTMMYVQ
jgi:hypothetical protein